MTTDNQATLVPGTATFLENSALTWAAAVALTIGVAFAPVSAAADGSAFVSQAQPANGNQAFVRQANQIPLEPAPAQPTPQPVAQQQLAPALPSTTTDDEARILEFRRAASSARFPSARLMP